MSGFRLQMRVGTSELHLVLETYADLRIRMPERPANTKFGSNQQRSSNDEYHALGTVS